jgi:hypothetical protein
MTLSDYRAQESFFEMSAKLTDVAMLTNAMVWRRDKTSVVLRATMLRWVKLYYTVAIEEFQGIEFGQANHKSDLLTDEEEDMLLEDSNRAVLVMSWMMHSLTRYRAEWSCGDPQLSRLIQVMTDTSRAYNNTRRIVETPFPFPFSQVSFVIIHFWLFLSPVFVGTFLPGSSGLAFITALSGTWILFAVNEVSAQLEGPFEEAENDLPIVHYQIRFNDAINAINHLDPPSFLLPGPEGDDDPHCRNPNLNGAAGAGAGSRSQAASSVGASASMVSSLPNGRGQGPNTSPETRGGTTTPPPTAATAASVTPAAAAAAAAAAVKDGAYSRPSAAAVRPVLRSTSDGLGAGPFAASVSEYALLQAPAGSVLNQPASSSYPVGTLQALVTPSEASGSGKWRTSPRERASSLDVSVALSSNSSSLLALFREPDSQGSGRSPPLPPQSALDKLESGDATLVGGTMVLPLEPSVRPIAFGESADDSGAARHTRQLPAESEASARDSAGSTGAGDDEKLQSPKHFNTVGNAEGVRLAMQLKTERERLRREVALAAFEESQHKRRQRNAMRHHFSMVKETPPRQQSATSADAGTQDLPVGFGALGSALSSSAALPQSSASALDSTVRLEVGSTRSRHSAPGDDENVQQQPAGDRESLGSPASRRAGSGYMAKSLRSLRRANTGDGADTDKPKEGDKPKETSGSRAAQRFISSEHAFRGLVELRSKGAFRNIL